MKEKKGEKKVSELEGERREVPEKKSFIEEKKETEKSH